MFEFLLAEWGVTKEHILSNWTDEEFDLMTNKLIERREKEARAWRSGGPTRVVSDMQFFREAGINYNAN